MTEPAARRRPAGGGLIGLGRGGLPPLLAAAVLVGVLCAWVVTGGAGTLRRQSVDLELASIPVNYHPGAITARTLPTYLVLRNLGGPDTLVSARSPDARRVLLVRDGAEPSRPDGELANIGLPAHAAITFSPFGTDLVLIRPAPVRVGELVPVILIFRKAGHVTIDLTVTDSLTSP